MRANDITVGEHYAYTECRSDLDRLIWAREVEVLEVALDTKGPHGSWTVHVHFVNGPELVGRSFVPEAWVRPATIACGWEEAVARRAAMQRDEDVAVVAREAARAAEEQARQEAVSRFTMQEVRDTEWVITFDSEPRSSAVPPVVVATLNRSFFAEYQAKRVLAGLCDHFIEEAAKTACGEVHKRMSEG